MELYVTDEIINKIADEYHKTNDSKIILEMAQDKAKYNIIEIAKNCDLKTFQQFFNEYLKINSRLN